MKYLLDTNTCVFLLKTKYGVEKKVNEIGLQNCCISEITLGELLVGAYNSVSVRNNLEEIETFIESIIVIPISDCLYVFGQEKVRLKKLGMLIHEFDLLIGSTAVYYELVLVTNNTRHFSRLRNIQLEDWVTNN